MPRRIEPISSILTDNVLQWDGMKWLLRGKCSDSNRSELELSAASVTERFMNDDDDGEDGIMDDDEDEARKHCR